MIAVCASPPNCPVYDTGVNRPTRQTSPTKSFSEIWEHHPLKIIGSAIALGFAMGVGFVTYAWLPSQTMELRRQLDDCVRSGRLTQSTPSSTPVSTSPSAAPSVRAAPEARPAISVLPSPSENPLESPLQLETQFKGREGRFGEVRTLLRSLEGKAVDWTVAVRRISEFDAANASIVMLHFGPAQNPDFILEHCSAATFASNEIERLSALRPADIVRLRGTLHSIGHDHMNVDKAQLDFIKGGDKE
jgi:hypothetical protein